jgi:hypothetical protein
MFTVTGALSNNCGYWRTIANKMDSSDKRFFIVASQKVKFTSNFCELLGLVIQLSLSPSMMANPEKNVKLISV